MNDGENDDTPPPPATRTPGTPNPSRTGPLPGAAPRGSPPAKMPPKTPGLPPFLGGED